MSLVKTQQEYNNLKKEFKNDITLFLIKFDDFIRYTSPSYWRTTGNSYSNLLNLKDNIDRLEPLKMKDLENDFIRDEILSDEEKELYDKIKKYNL